MTTAADVNAGLAGVGVFFQQDPDSHDVFVRSLVPGGSADRCGKILANDVIVSVDGSAVRGRSLQELRDLILGAPGSNISLSFMRGPNPQDPSSTTQNFSVQLMRGSPQYLASLSGPSPAPPASSPPVAVLPSNAPASSPSFTSPNLPAVSPVQSYTIPIADSHPNTSPHPSSSVPVQQPQSQGFGDEERARLRAALVTKESEYKAQVAALNEHVRRASEREARANSELAHVRADKQRLEALLQDAQNKLRDAPSAEEVAWLREREKSFSAAVEKMKQEYEEDRARSDAFLRKNEEAAAADRRKREEAEVREARLQEELRRAGEIGGVNAERDNEIRRALGEERRKLSEALAMTEKVAEIVRAMEPRFGAIDRELSQQPSRPEAPSAAPAVAHAQYADALWGHQLTVGSTPNDDEFFVA